VTRVFRIYRDAFAGLPAQVWWLSATIFVNRAGTMVLPFLALYLTRERGLDVADVGGFLALYGVGAIAGIALGGRGEQPRALHGPVRDDVLDR
jgi:predicted MFS family arabinose efflux permease